MSTLQLITPIDGSVYAERQCATHSEAHIAFERARNAQRIWARRPLSERIEAIQRFLFELLAMRDEMLPELAWQMGRPIRYGGEWGGVSERSEYMVSIASVALAPIEIERSDTLHRRIMREPLGVIMVIAPWNYPYLTAINSIIPALIAGNAVILKHASQTLLVGERFQMAADRSGIDKGLFCNLHLDHRLTETLLSEGLADHVNFTGSVEGGRAIERACAGTFTSIGLELGGKDPAYVCADADLEQAAESLIDGAMFNSGQCCCGIERIYVHERLYDAFVEKAAELAGNYIFGDPLDFQTTLGPMAATRFADLVREQTAQAVALGAIGVVDARKFPAEEAGTPYLAPQVLVDVNHSMRVMQEESFGPVVGVMKVASDSEAAVLMNDSPYGLTASIWSSDLERVQRIGEDLETGTVFMNRCDYVDPALCWTGCKNTGRGGALSAIGYHNLTRPKSFHLRII